MNMLKWGKNGAATITSPFPDSKDTFMSRFTVFGNDLISITGNEMQNYDSSLVLSKVEAQALVNYLTSVIPSMKDL